MTPDPIDPDEIEIDVNYDPDPTDLVLSSVPGGELFDPRKHRFSEEELKPQPMIKKAKKVFVPEEQKVSEGGGARAGGRVADVKASFCFCGRELRRFLFYFFVAELSTAGRKMKVF